MAAWISDSWKGVMMRRGFGVVEFNHLRFCWDDWKRCKYKEGIDFEKDVALLECKNMILRLCN